MPMASPWAAALQLLLLLLAALVPSPSTAAIATNVKAQQRLMAQLAGDLAVDRVARLLMLQPAGGTSPWAAAPLLRNATLQPLFAAVDRCTCVVVCGPWGLEPDIGDSLKSR